MPFNDPFFRIFDHFDRAFDNAFNGFHRDLMGPSSSSLIADRDFFGSSFDNSQVGTWGSWGHGFSGNFEPAMNVKESDDTYTVEISAPGVSKKNIVVDYDQDTRLLSIRGEIPKSSQERQDKEGRTIYREMSQGQFQRSFKLPSNADAENIRARFADGLLTLKVPKTPRVEEVTDKKQILIGD